jgi:hypothetical protein
MATEIKDELGLVLKTAGFGDSAAMLVMHLSEIEQEAETVLDLLTVSRSHAYRGDSLSTQETLAELTIALEHLLHHVSEALPNLQKELDIELD